MRAGTGRPLGSTGSPGESVPPGAGLQGPFLCDLAVRFEPEVEGGRGGNRRRGAGVCAAGGEGGEGAREWHTERRRGRRREGVGPEGDATEPW